MTMRQCKRKQPILTCLFFFFFNSFAPIPVMAQSDPGSPLRLPPPGVMVDLSPPFNPPILKGIKVHANNPFRFDFILDTGDNLSLRGAQATKQSQQEQLKTESLKLIKYFLASITIPEKDLWVNLSPYEKDRIIPHSFGLTAMGRDLLAEDYILKQITASVIYPEGKTGKRFWERVYKEAVKRFGTTQVAVNTFNKVWILPEKAVVFENAKADTAYVVEAKLKVMLEQDYVSLQKHNHSMSSPNVSIGDPENATSRFPIKAFGNDKNINTLGSQIIREIVIPQLTKEVNENKNFAKLRQVYHSLILATWYKKKIRDSILAQVYADKNKVIGLSSPISIGDPKYIYQQYLKAFKKGVFNYIKEEQDPLTRQPIPRKYFSGGLVLLVGLDVEHDPPSAAMASNGPQDGQAEVSVEVISAQEAAATPLIDPGVMDRRFFIRSSIVLALATGFPALLAPRDVGAEQPRPTEARAPATYFGFFQKQKKGNSHTGLSISNVGDSDPHNRYGSQTYDTALEAIAFRGQRAGSKIIQTYAANVGFSGGENHPQTMSVNYDPNGVINNVRIAHFEPNWWKSWEFKVSADNAWIGLAALHHYKASSKPDLDALKFAQERAKFLISLQDKDGGIRFGPKGQYHKGGSKEFYWNLKSTEGNESALHFLDALFEITNEPKYREAADRIYHWLMTEMYDKKENIFRRGAVFNPKSNSWEKDGHDKFAPDTVSWAPFKRMLEDPRLGKNRLDRLKKIDAMMEKTKTWAGVWKRGKLVGISFSSASAKKGIISIEWSSQFAIRIGRIAQEFNLGDPRKAKEYEKEREGLIKELRQYFKKKGEFLVAPYAVYVNTGRIAYGIDTGHGWKAPNAYASKASAYYFFACKGFDPLRLHQNPAMLTAAVFRPVVAGIRDHAMKPFQKGGIDLTASNKYLQIQNNGIGSIKFHIDPAMLQQLHNAPGFIPIVIHIDLKADLKKFLGV